MTSKPSSSRVTAANTAGVRRNLFHHHLSRRPTSASVSTSTTTFQEPILDDSAEIVVRDRNGSYQVQVPLLPPLNDEDALEEELTSEKESGSDFSQ